MSSSLIYQYLSISIFLLFCSTTLQAQFPTNRGNNDFGGGFGQNGGLQQDSLNPFVETVDTFGVFYFLIDNPNELIPVEDTSLLNFHLYDPTRNRRVDYKTLGNFGSAHQPLLYESSTRQGFDVGYHQYDLYYIKPEQLQFNVLEKPYTNLFYSQGATQADGMFKGKFSRNFSDGFRFTIQSSSIRQLGTAEQYPNQQVENIAVGSGLWFDAPSDNYDGFLYFTSNSTQAQENGGLLALPTTDDEAPGGNTSQTASVLLPDNTGTRHVQRSIGLVQYFKLFQGKKQPETTPPTRKRVVNNVNSIQMDSIRIDSTQMDTTQMDSLRTDTLKRSRVQRTLPTSAVETNQRNRAFTAMHKVQFDNRIFKFADDFSAAGSAIITDRSNYYNDLFTDERGLRSFIRHNSLKNTFKLGTFRQSDEANAAEQDRLEVGLAHTIHLVEQGGQDTTLNNLFLTGRVDFRVLNSIQLRTSGHFGLLANAGDYKVRGDLDLDFGKIGTLAATFINQAYQPNLVQDQFFVTQQRVWNTDFRKTFETSIQGTYDIPSLNLSFTGAYHLINNYIYFDTLAMPQQLGEILNVVNFTAQHRLKIGILHFHNLIALQATSQEVFRTPSWFSKHSLFVQATLFKKALDFQLGVDLRMNETYFGTYYQPLVGQFQLYDQQQIEFFPAVDAFLNLKIKQVRLFVKTENLGNLIQPNQLYEQVATYGYPQFFLRFGLNWKLVN